MNDFEAGSSHVQRLLIRTEPTKRYREDGSRRSSAWWLCYINTLFAGQTSVFQSI
ncbi:predicted protein [Botrytis cinerea T4]|uniref:Uncharacterized protein n=1 Tax=Botryotinia fuckeliana (strain T4) TaxID=999810 RepID=G2Y0R9_BOTF4|nr:predicted protein [Botrytis cinerea T4]